MAKRDVANYGISITLPLDKAKALLESVTEPMTEPEKMAGLATGLLTEIAEGGMMLDAQTVDRLRETMGELEEPADLIPVVEKGCGVQDGDMIIPVRIDPVHVEPLRELAESQENDPEYVIQDLVNYILETGEYYDMPTDIRAVRFSKEQDEALQELVGIKHYTGEDLFEFIRRGIEAAGEPPAASEPDGGTLGDSAEDPEEAGTGGLFESDTVATLG